MWWEGLAKCGLCEFSGNGNQYPTARFASIRKNYFTTKWINSILQCSSRTLKILFKKVDIIYMLFDWWSAISNDVF